MFDSINTPDTDCYSRKLKVYERFWNMVRVSSKTTLQKLLDTSLYLIFLMSCKYNVLLFYLTM